MLIILFRETFRPDCTLGTLIVPSSTLEPLSAPAFTCDTLEPPALRKHCGIILPPDEPHQLQTMSDNRKGCIPLGLYPLRLTQSPRFGRILPIIDGVPGFTGIRIHAGNRPSDTCGCILVGNLKPDDNSGDNNDFLIINSRRNEAALINNLRQLTSPDEEIYIDITTRRRYDVQRMRGNI